MKKRANCIRNISVLNIAMIVFTIISIIMDVIGLPSVLNPQREYYDYLDKMGVNSEAIFNHAQSMPVKINQVLCIIVSIVLLFFYFKNYQKMKKGIIPNVIPYGVFIGWEVVQFLFSILYDPFDANQLNVEGFLSLLFLYILYCLISIIIMIYYQKIKKEENKNAEDNPSSI